MIQLIKKTTKSILIYQLQVENQILQSREGKVGKTLSSYSSMNCQTRENALEEAEKLIENLKSQGYILDNTFENNIDFIVFDKAKWHYGGDFPTFLPFSQAYIHTGFYLGWLIKRNLLCKDLQISLREKIKIFLNQNLSPITIFQEEFDGVLTSEEMTLLGYKFSICYYENGDYVDDYERTFETQIKNSLYEVQDNWENFNKICGIINAKFDQFLNDNHQITELRSQ